MFTRAELSYCNMNSISICPAHIPIFNNRLISCESSLFFQTADSRNLCQRKILPKHTTPLLHRYGSSWIFYLPGNQLTTLRCHTNNTSTTSTRTLQGNGIIAPSPRTTKYRNSKKRSPQKPNASATSRPDSQRPAELWICTPFSARVEPWTSINNDPTGT